MFKSRQLSLDPVTIPEWRWRPFLAKTIDALSIFELKPYPVEKEFLDKEAISRNKNKPVKVLTSTWACKTNKLRQVRAACVEARGIASVLNLVANPLNHFDLPFFGADFVTLPSGHLLALDLQPVLKDDYLHTNNVWERLIPLHQNWQAKLPSGGSIPSEAESYFSPGFLWTRLPLNESSDKVIENIIMPAFEAYLSLYIDLVKEAKSVSNERSNYLYQGQSNYQDYRSKKDPARPMLTSFYGKEWTESYIHEVLFDLKPCIE